MTGHNGGINGEVSQKLEEFATLAREMTQTAVSVGEDSTAALGESRQILHQIRSMLRFVKALIAVLVGALVGGAVLGVIVVWLTLENHNQTERAVRQAQSNGDAVAYLRECTEPGPRTPTKEDPRTGNACYDRLRLSPSGENPALLIQCQNAYNEGLKPPACEPTRQKLVENGFVRP